VNTQRKRLEIDDAKSLALAAVGKLGYQGDEGTKIVHHLLDAALCGYEYAGLPKILDAAAHPQRGKARYPIRVVSQTALSIVIDGGNHIGMLALDLATRQAIELASGLGVAVLGLHNSWMTGRSAYFLEQVARAGFVGLLTVSTTGLVAPSAGIKPVLGTNPIAWCLPATPDPAIVDVSTSAIAWADLALHALRNEPIADGLAIDAQGLPTNDAQAARSGAILPFGGTKGYALSFAVQMLGRRVHVPDETRPAGARAGAPERARSAHAAGQRLWRARGLERADPGRTCLSRTPNGFAKRLDRD
jgi:LDH2 family malate/lactate/ureidoglycolate dehydrogenase